MENETPKRPSKTKMARPVIILMIVMGIVMIIAILYGLEIFDV